MKKSRLVFVLTLLVFLLTLQTFGASTTSGTDGSGSKSSESFTLVQKDISVIVGESLNLNVKGDVEKSKIKWKSSNKKVAVVSGSGKIKTKRTGSTVITAKLGKCKRQCTIHVVKKIELSRFLGKKYTYYRAKFPNAYQGKKSRRRWLELLSDGYPAVTGEIYYIAFGSCGYVDAPGIMKGYSILGITLGMDEKAALRILKKAGWEKTDEYDDDDRYSFLPPKNWKYNSYWRSWYCDVVVKNGKVTGVFLGEGD